MTNQRDDEEVRRRLTAFAATVPDHGLNAFGQLVEIQTVQRLRASGDAGDGL